MKVKFESHEIIAKLRTLPIGTFFQCEGKLLIKLEDAYTSTDSTLVLCRRLEDFKLMLLEADMSVIPIDHENIEIKYRR